MACKLVLPSKEIIKLSSFPQTFEDLLHSVRNRLGMSHSENILLRYMDVDKELISLANEEEFQTAKLTNEAEHIKTLKVFISFEEQQCSAPVNNHSFLNGLNLSHVHEEPVASNKTPPHTQSTLRRAKTSPFEVTGMTQEADNISLTHDQLEAIDSFIESKIRSAVEENMKHLFPGYATSINTKGADKSPSLETNDVPSQNASGPLSCPIVRSQTFLFKKGGQERKCEFVCNECEKQITGVKYQCLECSSYKCCESCEQRVEHPHPLLKVRASIQDQQVQSRQSLNYSLYVSPEKTNKSCVGNLAVRQSLSRNSCEKKPQYCGKVQTENGGETLVSTCPSQEYKVVVHVKNIGSESWPKDVRLCCVNGIHRGIEEKLTPLEAKGKQTVCLSLEAPSNAGKYLSQWRLYYNDGEKAKSFGESLFIEIQVEEKIREIKNRISSAGVHGESLSAEKIGYKKLRSMEQVPVGLENKRPEKIITSRANKKEKIANYLNEIFPGNLDEKYSFLGSFENIEDQTIEKIVELYLLSLSKSRVKKSSKPKEAYGRQRHELSLTL